MKIGGVIFHVESTLLRVRQHLLLKLLKLATEAVIESEDA